MKLEASGIHYFDYLDVYKKFTYNVKPSYALDNIAKDELGYGKVPHNSFSSSLKPV